MELLVWLLPGALIGWTASVLMRRGSGAERCFNIAVGIAGAAIGSWLLGPLLSVPGTIGTEAGAGGAANVQMAVLGAILLVAAVNVWVPARLLRLRRAPRGVRVAGTSGSHQAARG